MSKCAFCNRKPSSREEKIASFALSIECLKEHNLKKGSEYIKKTRKLPHFHESVQKKALSLVENYIDFDNGQESDSFELSDSFFEMEPEGLGPSAQVTVHAIGKPENVALTQRGGKVNNRQTYHQLTWEIGKDISKEDYDSHKDSTGVLFVWFRWMNDKWLPKCISREEFEQLRNVER